MASISSTAETTPSKRRRHSAVRIISVKLNSKFRKIIMIQWCMPPPNKMNEKNNDVFYEQLEACLVSLCYSPQSDIKILMDNFNANVGQDENLQAIIGHHSLYIENYSNENRLTDFCWVRIVVPNCWLSTTPPQALDQRRGLKLAQTEAQQQDFQRPPMVSY